MDLSSYYYTSVNVNKYASPVLVCFAQNEVFIT
jgi:hypothetical protein